jgi:broad specificity polyphosphatase/5'/3'-nucleotidase SurE
VANQGHLDVTWNIHKKNDPVNHPYYWLHATYERKMSENSDIVLLEKENCITITPLQSRHEFSGCMEKLEEIFASNA